MELKRRLLRAGAVLVVALGAGHLVQTLSADREDRRIATAPVAPASPKKIEKVSAGPAPDPAPAAAPVAAVALVPDGSSPAPADARTELAALTGDTLKLPPLQLLPPLPHLAPAEKPVPSAPAPSAPVETVDCTPQFTLTAAPRAMLALALSAPCAAGQRVVLRHAGLAVAEALDADGRLALDLPALDAAGAVSVLFADASIAIAEAPLEDTDLPRRFAVQWMADDAFQIRAVEAGQAYGDAGNVSVEAPVSAQGGYLVTLGDPVLDLPMRAQIYTWPADPALHADPVVEAVVTDATCGRDLLGETLLSQDGKTIVTDLTVSMPGCDALGDILVLNNLAGGVTLAAQN
jgi:hypothetical protein